jgi:uncharacterized protein YgiB involved in biofilm formation
VKRSRSIQLALMGSVPLLLAAGCDDRLRGQEPALLYQDLQQCIADGKVSADVCQNGYEQALAAERNAPHYNSLADCEAEYGWGNCHAPTGGGNWFVPAAAGFLIARALDAHRYDQPYYGGYGGGWSAYHGWMGQPLYQARGDRGSWRTLSGERYGWGARGPAAYNSTAETLSRGGFGRTAAARGSWGG